MTDMSTVGLKFVDWSIPTNTLHSSTYFRTDSSKLTPRFFVWQTTRKPGARRRGQRLHCGQRKHSSSNRINCAWWLVAWCRLKVPCACVSAESVAWCFLDLLTYWCWW